MHWRSLRSLKHTTPGGPSRQEPSLQVIDSPSAIVLFTDSTYVVNAFNRGWIKRWVSENWRTKDGVRANADLWRSLAEEVERHEQVRFRWVKGHSGHPENERCDELANSAAQKSILQTDHGYRE